MISTKLDFDPTVSQYYKVTDIASGWDSIIPATGSWTSHYNTAEMRILKVVPFCGFAQRNPIDPNGVSLNNGTHCVKHSDGGYQTVYVRGDSVFERKMTDCGVSGEQCVEPGGNVQNMFGICNSCGDGYNISQPPPPEQPPITDLSSIQPDNVGPMQFYTKCSNPTIAQHRSVPDEDLIVWEEDCIAYYSEYLGNNDYFNFTTTDKTIRAVPWSYGMNTQLGSSLILIADSLILGHSTTFPATPVVTGTNSGYIIAFADSGNGIKVCALQGSAGNYWYSDSIYTINCPSKNQPAMYPSIAWGTDNIPSNSWFEPTAHLVWQEQNSIGSNQIWHGNCYYRTVNNY